MAFGIAPRNLDALRYEGESLYILPAIEAPRAPLVTDVNYPLFTVWRNSNKLAVSPDAEGDMWVLTRFNQTGTGALAVWSRLTPGGGTGVNTLSDTAGTTVNPNVAGNIQLRGGSGVTITSNPGSNLLDVSLVGGGTAIDQIATETGTSPVVPDSTGQITINSTTQVNNGVAPNGIITIGDTNRVALALQRAGQAESINTNLNGIAHFQGGSFYVQGGFVKSAPMPGVENIGFTYNAGTFSLRVIYGTGDLLPSLVQPGIFNFPYQGVVVACSIKANQTFIDASGASTITGNLFGFGAADAVATDVPFFLYGVASGSLASCCFMISREPGRVMSPVIGDIGYSGNPVADNQNSFFALSPFPEAIANYASQPCVCLGSFRMRLSAGGAWTVQALGLQDAIGTFQEENIFTIPTGVLGAATGTHWLDNGGTAPAFSNPSYAYTINREGYVYMAYQADAVTTPGTGIVAATLAMPFKGPVSVLNASAGKGNYATAGQRVLTLCDVMNTQPSAQFISNIGILFNSDLTNTGAGAVSLINTNVYYKAAVS